MMHALMQDFHYDVNIVIKNFQNDFDLENSFRFFFREKGTE